MPKLADSLPADFRETLTEARQSAEAAIAELRRGVLFGPKFVAYCAPEGPGHPVTVAHMLAMLEQLLDALERRERDGVQAVEAVTELATKTREFTDTVRAFLGERFDCLALRDNAENAHPGSTRAARWEGHAHAREQLARALGWHIAAPEPGRMVTVEQLLAAHLPARITPLHGTYAEMIECTCGETITASMTTNMPSPEAYVMSAMGPHIAEAITAAALDEGGACRG